MKFKLLLIIILTNFGYSQNINKFIDNYSFEKKIIIQNDYIGSMPMIYHDGISLYLMGTEKLSDENNFAFYALYKDDKLYYVESKHKNFFPVNFAIVNKNLFLLTLDHLYIFNYKDKDSTYYYSDRYSIDPSLTYIKPNINKTKIFLYGITLRSANLKSKNHTKFQIFDINKNRLEKLQTISDPSAFAFCLFQPRQFIDMNDNFVVVSDIIYKTFRIYNHNAELIHTIKDSFYNSRKTTVDSLEYILSRKSYIKENIHKFMGEIRDYNKFIPLVHNIWLSKKNELVVMYSEPTGTLLPYNIKVDKWIHSNNSWTKIWDRQGDNICKNDEILTYSNLGFYNEFKIFDKLFIINKESFPLDFKEQTKREYEKNVNEFFKKNDIKSIYYIYRETQK